MSSTELDHRDCYRAVASRDRRFDGVFFTGVHTTGIYCRPSCPAITPRAENVEFFRTAAAAQRAGFRACKRCAPDSAPGSPEWDQRGDTIGRAMQLIDDGVVDRDGVSGLADRVGYSPRHLHRLLVDELGAGTLDLARARRAHTARHLIAATDMSFTDIAFAAGFGSIRQFNETIQSVYATTPTELKSRPRRGTSTTGAISVHLATRPPFASAELFRFLSARAIGGVEVATDTTYARTLDLPRGHGVVTIRRLDPTSRAGNRPGVDAEFVLADVRDLAPAIRRVRTLLDLDADPHAIDGVLGTAGPLVGAVAATPGLRSPGSVSVWEMIVRAIIGQQVSVAGARTVAGRLVQRFGEPLQIDIGANPADPQRTPTPDVPLDRVFIAPDKMAAASPDDEVFAMPTARANTLVSIARAIVEGTIDIDADRTSLRRQLVSQRGVGPWTADYVMMRGCHDPDVFLQSDLGVRHGLAGLGVPEVDDGDVASQWSPWRSYAVHHLWHQLGSDNVTAPTATSRPAKKTRNSMRGGVK